jgi:hypothetical protein
VACGPGVATYPLGRDPAGAGRDEHGQCHCAIRRIFHEFVVLGYSTARIAERLNARRVPPPGGDRWTTRHVLACLRNKAYASPITYRRRRNRRPPSGAKTPDGWVHTPKARDGIISQEQFQRAQEMLA